MSPTTIAPLDGASETLGFAPSAAGTIDESLISQISTLPSEDIYRFYAFMRSRHPVFWSEAHKGFFLFKYDHIRTALTTEDFTVEFPLRASRRVFGRNLLDTDGPGHRCLRRLVNPLFSPAAVESYTSAIESIVSDLIGGIDPSGSIDFASDFAIHLPYRAMCNFLGMPVGDASWLYEQMRPIVKSLDLPPSCIDEARIARKELDRYFAEILASKHLNSDGTILATLAHAEEFGTPIDEQVRLSTALLLLLAGTETSLCAIINTMVSLLRHPNAFRAMKDCPAMIANVVAESLRWEPPLHSVLRFATSDVEIGGVAIPRRSPVYLCLASANRDQEHFRSPEAWHPDRAEQGYLTFGTGKHGCPGAMLAEREFCTIFRQLAEQFEEIVPRGEIPPIVGHAFRRPECLPVLLIARVKGAEPAEAR